MLDIACGTGEFERLVLTQQSMQEIIGVDISEKMLAIARQKLHAYPNVSFYTALAGFDICCVTRFRFNVVWGMMAATAMPHNYR